MSLVSVPAIYDGKTIRLLESVSMNSPYRVVVTFLEPIREANAARNLDRFWASFGAWVSEESAEETVRRIRESRRSRSEPPNL
ncbi:MAG: hypothetical protein FJ030_13970 [Chloroflexi bacterium]|nr:hypothetical protein [Chloroflexota bacterium]